MLSICNAHVTGTIGFPAVRSLRPLRAQIYRNWSLGRKTHHWGYPELHLTTHTERNIVSAQTPVRVVSRTIRAPAVPPWSGLPVPRPMTHGRSRHDQRPPVPILHCMERHRVSLRSHDRLNCDHATPSAQLFNLPTLSNASSKSNTTIGQVGTPINHFSHQSQAGLKLPQ